MLPVWMEMKKPSRNFASRLTRSVQRWRVPASSSSPMAQRLSAKAMV